MRRLNEHRSSASPRSACPATDRRNALGSWHLLPAQLRRAPRAAIAPTLGEAIGDLPLLNAGEGNDKSDYEMDRRKVHVAEYGRSYFYSTLGIARASKLTAHKARPHSDRDLRDFLKLREGENAGEALRRGETFEFPYDRASFTDRYTRQHRDEQCSTIVAHLSKDGLMFIHPTQNRSLTPREAARVQSFPDWFEFPVARTHQFRMIGNAVPPLVAESVGIAIRDYLGRVSKDRRKAAVSIARMVPRDREEATQRVAAVTRVTDSKTLKRFPSDDFKYAWFAISFLYPELHPDGALEHGTRISSEVAELLPASVDREPAPYYVRSGWPVALEPVAKEAWRRFRMKQLSDEEFYCSCAAHAGLSQLARRPVRRELKASA